MTSTIPSLLRHAAKLYSDRPALSCASDGASSFAEVDALADRFARALIGDGMAHGERVGIWAGNMMEWVAAAAGTQRVGGAIVPLNTRLKGGEVADIVRRANVTRLVVIGEFLKTDYPAMLRNETLPQLKRVIVLRSQPDRIKGKEELWEGFLQRGDAVPDAEFRAREAAVGPDTIADIMFTSGTTGAPKGAVFDHRRSLGGGRAWAGITGMTAQDRYACFGPFSHNASYKAGWVTGLMTGATLYWPEAYDAETVLGMISRDRITVMPAPPTVWQDVLDHPHRRDWDISSLSFLSTGATVVPIELVRRLAAETEIEHITTGYGMTECCGSATHTVRGDPVERVAYTVGKAIVDTEIQVVDADGRPAAPGERGEVLIRDDKLLIEYLDNPEETRLALDADGWLHSGDIGSLDEHGYLRISDRLKDMFIVGGFNVYPAEIEKQMSAVPGLAACAVIGVPNGRLGEVGHAFIVRSPGSTLTEAEVQAWCKANLANYKIPRGVTFLDTLPLNTTGKVVKPQLRALL
nr:AMP-binding protein [uncultured Brevundimonas sp.]